MEKPWTPSLIRQIAWAYYWRIVVFGILGTIVSMILGAVAGLVVWLIGSALSLTPELTRVISALLGGLLGLFVALILIYLVFRHVLTMKYETFRLAPVERDLPMQPPMVS